MRILHPQLHLDHLAAVMVLVLQTPPLHHKLRLRVTRIQAATITAELRGTVVATVSHVRTNLHHPPSHFMQEVLLTGRGSVITASRVVIAVHCLQGSALVDRKMKQVLQLLSSFSAAVSELQGQGPLLCHLMSPRYHPYLRAIKAKPSFLAAR